MSTEEIFARLNRLGVAVTPEEFRQAAQRHESAERLADEWRQRYPFHPEGRYDEDFIWMAATVLWKRLVSDRISFEQIDERMQEGYDLLEAHRVAEACDVWWHVWEWLKEKVTPERNTVAALDEAFRGMQSVYNWCSDFHFELENAGVRDPAYSVSASATAGSSWKPSLRWIGKCGAASCGRRPKPFGGWERARRPRPSLRP
jgi:hypothetical protein